MKLSEYRELAAEHSGQTSDKLRVATLGGIGIVWLFKAGSEGRPELPSPLIPPLLLFAVGMSLDLLQSLAATVIWNVFHWVNERKLAHPETDDPDLAHSDAWPALLYSIFYIKIGCTVAGYVLLIRYLISIR